MNLKYRLVQEEWNGNDQIHYDNSFEPFTEEIDNIGVAIQRQIQAVTRQKQKNINTCITNIDEVFE